jgi:DNA polymerase/3'-5' exonuclease PolX
MVVTSFQCAAGAKIRQLLTTGRVHKLEGRLDNSVHKACKELVKVFGIGPVKARQLASAPYHVSSIKELQRKVVDGTWKSLTNRGNAILDADSITCLNHIDDLIERIPREEVERIITHVQLCAERVYGKDVVYVMCCGSYRRCKPTSGDVDILITTTVSLASPCATCEH